MLKVSVCMVTYNHEPFIAQAIESVLMQRTNFAYELVIGEDCSTDGTRRVVERYAERHPDVVRPLFREQNLGMHRNFVDTLSRCRGEYVALLEGDDYWTDPYKLQKQAEFLDEHPEYVLVSGNAVTIREDEGYRVLRVAKEDQPVSFDFGARELMLGNPCLTLTVMFRNGLVREFPDLYYRGSGGDRRFYLLLSEHGKCRYVNDLVGAYRVHSGSSVQRQLAAPHGRILCVQEQIRNAEAWNRYFGGRYAGEVEEVRLACSKHIVRFALEEADIHTALSYAWWIDPTRLVRRRVRFAIGLMRYIARVLRVGPPSLHSAG